MKKLILFVLFTAQICAAQYYTLHTNLWHTNTITAASTNTYAGTNYLDFTRYREALLAVSGQSAGNVSNYVGQSWLTSPDSTNWDYGSVITFELRSEGTNLVLRSTPVDWTTIGYLRPYQVWNTNASDFTNVNVGVWTKSVPRN
jgi:hypothetical protein